MLMLAQPYSEKRNISNWFWSEKLDGVRAELRDGHLISRNNKPIIAPDWWLKNLPKNLNLDGELFCGRGMFQKLVSFVRKKIPIDHEWEQVNYLVFDCLNEPNKPFSERHSQIPIHLALPHHSITNIQEHFQTILSIGGEGIMLRNPQSSYERKRSWNLLKLKPELSMEVRVIGHTKGEGKHVGRLGALQCITNDGNQFQVGTGFTDAQRENPPKKGVTVKILYQELTIDLIPRFPVFSCVI
jgi:DNA ligase-1